MSNVWLVRPEPHNINRITEFRDNNIIAIGWPNLDDLSHCSRETIKAKLKEPPYEYKSLKLGNAYATIDIFVNKMRVGDLVLVPNGSDIYFGKITSDYFYDRKFSSGQMGYPHQRNIDWLSNVSRTDLSMPLRKSLKVHRTVANLDKHFIEIDTLAKGEIYDEIIDQKSRTDNVENIVSVVYPLRHNFNVEFTIPKDTTKEEVERFSKFISTLYFNN